MGTETENTPSILDLAWKRSTNFSAHSGRRKNGFFDARLWIAILGVIATLIAILTQVNKAFLDSYPGLKLVAQILFVATPVLASMLAAFASKKYANGDWWVTRAASEEIRKEIYFYATIWPKEGRDEMLEKSLARIQRQVYQAMGGVFALEEPTKPARQLGFRDLTGEEYFQRRLDEQLTWHNNKISKLKKERDRMTILILATGALGTVLATLGTTQTLDWGIWVALTASITSALIGWEQLRGNETIIRNYSKVVLELSILRDHWLRLSPEQRATPLELEGLVKGCEKVLWEQNAEYIRAMQDLLKGNTLDEQAKAVTSAIEETVVVAKRTTQAMQDNALGLLTDTVNNTGQQVEATFQDTADALGEQSSRFVQKQLDAVSQAVTDAAENLVERTPTLTATLAKIAQDYSHVDVGRDTSKEELNQILASYPKTGEVKG